MFSRFACVRQHDSSDCGAAALATVALHHRLPVPLQKLRDLAGTDRIGTNLLGLLQAAEQLGFEARGVKGPYEELGGIPLPAIAHWITDEGLGHFVVLHRWGARGVTLADPARGVVRLTREEFTKHWAGYLLLLTPRTLTPPEGSGSPATPWRRFRGLLKPHAALMAEAFCCALLLTLLGLSGSFFVQHLVDSVLVHGETRLLNALGVGMGALLIFRVLFGALRQYLLVHVSRKVDLALVSGYARHVLAQPLRFFEMRRTGDVLARVHDAVKVRQAVSGTTLTAVVDASLVAASLAVMFACDARLAGMTAAFLPLFLLVVGVHHPSVRRLSREAMEKGAALEAHLIEDVSGVETIKAFGAEGRRGDDGDGRLVRFVGAVTSLQWRGVSVGAFGSLVAGATGIAVLWYGGHRMISGALTLGELMFFHSLVGVLLDPLARLATLDLQVQDALVAVDRLYEVLDLEREALHAEGKAEFRGVEREIALEGVRFQYGCRSEVLKGVDLRVPAGATVAIVGESGAGKSSLLKLLQRFHDPTGGRITIDGVDVRDFSIGSLRRRIGVVAQEPFLFTGSLRENLALGRPGADMNEIADAVRRAGLEEFVNSLPQRYETVLGERGANLSGGQRQRLAIARALLRDPDVLIFDEATSHLDTATERAIQDSLRTALRGKTVLIVAHRLSTVRDADRIYVLHDGAVAEEGTHRDLLARGGRYASLWWQQAGADTRRRDPSKTRVRHA